MALLGLAASIAATLGVYTVYKILNILYKEFNSPLHNVPGPKSAHWFFGNRLQIFKHVEDDQEGLWTEQYGRTVRINNIFGFSQLFTTDNKALQHIISNSYIYQKPAAARSFLTRLVGPGVLVVEEDVHKKQRKILNPAFGSAQLRALTEIFVQKSKQLRDLWADRAAEGGGVARVNVIPEFSTATLDIIGKAGFNYDFHSLGSHSEGARDELHKAFATIAAAGEKPTGLLNIFKSMVPFLGAVLPRRKIDKVIDSSKAVMRRIGLRLLSESRQKIAEGSNADSIGSRDLLSLLVRANMAKHIPEAQRLSEEDVLARTCSVKYDCHRDTKPLAATWALFALAENVEIQTRLRNELLTVDNENPSMDDLNALPYLDCVVRETMRAHAPVVATFRTAMRDDVIPLETPITEGQLIVVPITTLNRDPAIWGPDAHQFIPERWERSPPISTGIPGLWSHMMTFLGGPRACIGYRFSLVELKALLFTLVRGLEFELAVPAADIGRLPGSVVQQPIVRSDRAAGAQMPLLIKPFTQS
ncbi:cytochrome P450 [Mycena rosella]|uniref:Cytochrome P450 n=1 Tax=Mycena rosella TaxID=1033263 RepID=A0AAD7DYF8_MYCRO|nr:cytochrome P450 [Mycena rosella]